MRFRRTVALSILMLCTSCRGDPTPARASLDWSTVADDQMILIVTTDPEGRPRTTRLWLVVLEGSGYLRTSETPWSRDVERNPSFLLLADDVSYPVTAKRVAYGTGEHARVMDAFAKKYVLLGRTVLRFYSLIGRYSGPADAKIFRLTADAPAAPQGAAADTAPLDPMVRLKRLISAYGITFPVPDAWCALDSSQKGLWNHRESGLLICESGESVQLVAVWERYALHLESSLQCLLRGLERRPFRHAVVRRTTDQLIHRRPVVLQRSNDQRPVACRVERVIALESKPKHLKVAWRAAGLPVE